MIAAQEKASLINKFHGVKNEHAGSIIYELMNALLDEVREDNDNAEINVVVFNQGKIEAYKTLLRYLRDGLAGQKDA